MLVGLTDIGQKTNPSHCSVFSICKNEDGTEGLKQIHQKFLDNWDYTKQVAYVQTCIEYFNIPRMYVDNTRGEFENRGLPRQCILVALSNHDGPRAKSKMKMAVNFAKLVEQNRISLLDDDRYISQILCVTNDLQASNTPMGHGDSFISTMLAVAVYYDFYAKDRIQGFSSLGNLQEIFKADKPVVRSNDPWEKAKSQMPQLINDDNVCKICNKRGTLEKQENGGVHCNFCMADY